MSVTEPRTEELMEEPEFPQEDVADNQDSVVGWLKQQREDLRGGHELVLPIPGYQGRLHARYKPLRDKIWQDFKARQRKRQKVSGHDTPDLVLAADIIVAACDELLVRKPGASVLTPLDDEQGFRTGNPARWSKDTADRLGAPGLEKAADAVYSLFPRDDADEVIASVVEGHGHRIYEWLTNLDEETDEEVGEA